MKKRKKTSHQSKLKDAFQLSNSAAADHAVAEWAFAHDIPAGAFQEPFWKTMCRKLGKTSISYPVMNPQKLEKTMLPSLKKMALQEQKTVRSR